MNGSTYYFEKDNEQSANSLNIAQTNSVYDMCKEQKLSDLTANVVTMQVNNILKNLPNDGTKYSPEQVQEIFVKEAAFFENSVMRDQIFKLFTLKLNVETELHTMEHRFEEIEKQERKSRTRIFSLMTCWFTT